MDLGVLLHALVQRSEDLVVVIDDQLRLLWANDRVSPMLGYDADQLTGWSVLDVVHPDDAEVAATNLAAALGGDAPSEPTVVRVRHQDGVWRWVDVVGGELGDVPGLAPARYALYLREVTDRQESERLAAQVREAEERALRRSEERFRSLVLHASDGIVVIGTDGTVEEVNPDRGLFGPRPVDAVLGHNVFDWVHPDDAADLQAAFAELVATPGASLTRTFRIVPTQYRQADVADPFADRSRLRWIEATATNMLENPAIEGLVINYRDVSARVAAQADAQRLLEVFEAADDLIGVCDPHGRLLHLNRAGRVFGGLRGSLAETEVPGPWVTPEDARRLTGEIRDELDRTGRWTGDLHMVDVEGNEIAVLARFIAHRDAAGQVEFYSWILRDISDRKAREQRLEHSALHDPLTGLPNRSRLLDGLERAVREARSPAEGVAALFVDLDDFKDLNDRRGHVTGDELLRQIAERLREAVRPGDTVARYGGDEFVVVVESLADVDQAVEVAERIRAVLRQPIRIHGEDVVVGASIGIAATWGLGADGDPATPEWLLRSADAAMYEAKRRGRGEVVVAGS